MLRTGTGASAPSMSFTVFTACLNLRLIPSSGDVVAARSLLRPRFHRSRGIDWRRGVALFANGDLADPWDGYVLGLNNTNHGTNEQEQEQDKTAQHHDKPPRHRRIFRLHAGLL